MLDDEGLVIHPLRRWSTLALHFFARLSAAVNCIVYPFQLAFLGPLCLAEGSGWPALYIVLDIPLWIDALHTAERHAKEEKERRIAELRAAREGPKPGAAAERAARLNLASEEAPAAA